MDVALCLVWREPRAAHKQKMPRREEVAEDPQRQCKHGRRQLKLLYKRNLSLILVSTSTGCPFNR